MIYKIITMAKQEIQLRDEEALRKFLSEANSGKKLILTEYGVVNVSCVDSIVPYKEKNSFIAEMNVLGKKDVEEEVLGVSPFAKLLGEKMKGLTDNQRTLGISEGMKRS